MTERERLITTFIALLVITVLVIVIVMWGVSVLEEPPAQDPPTETVDTDTQVKADDPATWDTPPGVEETPSSSFPPSDEGAEPVATYQEASTDEWQLYLHFTDTPDTYLEWRFTARYSYDNCLIPSGREVYYTGTTDHEASDSYKRAALIAYSAYKVQTWCRLSGFPGSPYADEETALHFCQVLLDNGCAIEPALAIIGFESTYGLAAGSNDFGILWGPGRGGQVEDYVAYIHHFGIDGTDASDIARNYNPSGVYHDNVVRQAAAIRAEAY